MTEQSNDEQARMFAHENEYIRRLKQLLVETPEGPGRFGIELAEDAEHELRSGFRMEAMIALHCQKSTQEVRDLANIDKDELDRLAETRNQEG